MARRLPLLLALLLLAACAGRAPEGEVAAIECAPFARQLSGIQLSGDAADWWVEAQGQYARTSQPVAGGVLVFQRSNRLPAGHVSVVRSIVSSREIRVTQANWVHHRIGRDEPVVDVSPENDWSAVRVWWAPAGSLGATTYPTYGFIAPYGEATR